MGGWVGGRALLSFHQSVWQEKFPFLDGGRGQEDSDQFCSEEINDSALAFVGTDSITECITAKVAKLSLCVYLE